MSSVVQIAAGIAAFLLSVMGTRLVRSLALRSELLDAPNERSAHSVPTPRLGGIGIMAGLLPVATWAILTQRGGADAIVIVAATVGISVLGLADDLRPLPARWRFGVQLVLATVVVATSGTRLGAAWTLLPLPAWCLAPLSVLWIVWVTNLYNFMDGIDGLAGGQAVFACVAVALATAGGGPRIVGLLAVTLAAAALGFLIFNLPRASIFMGDAGATAIGFFLAALPFAPSSNGVPVEVVALALSLFILDATTTLVRRVARGERFYQAHRSHCYQRPLACGVGHRAITFAAYVGMLVVGAMAASYGYMPACSRVALLAAAGLVFSAYVVLVRWVERRRRGDDTLTV